MAPLNLPPLLRAAQDNSRRLRRLLGLGWKRFASVFALAVLSGVVESVVLVLMVRIAAALAAEETVVTFSIGSSGPYEWTLLELLVLAGSLALIRSAVGFWASYAIARLAADALRNVRMKLMHAYLEASWDAQAGERQSELVEVASGQANSIGQLIAILVVGCTQMLRMVVLVAGAVVVAPIGAVAIVLGAGGAFFLVRPIAFRLKEYSKDRIEASLGLSRSLHETSRIISEVRVFGVGDAVRERVDANIDSVSRTWQRAELLNRAMPSIYQLLAMVMLVVTVALLYNLDASPTAMGAVIVIMARALISSQGLQATMNRMYELTPLLDMVSERIRTYRANEEVRGDEPLEAVQTIEFDGVGYHYHAGTPALRGLTFRVERGEAIGIVGPSGAGKSTLVQVLLGLREPTEGEYRVNGRPTTAYRAEDWFDGLALVSQQPHLIEGTVADNIRFFRPDLTQDDIEQGARMANVHDDIVSWPDGYDTLVAEQGASLSGGQRQRLSLARAFAGRPTLLVLDEPTSALDMQSEALIREALEAAKAEMTLFIVAHRLSTLNVCDRIMVLDHGRLDSFAPACELATTNDFYREAVALSRLA